MRRLELVLPVRPRSKERPRFSGKTRVPFNTASYRTWKDAVREYIERAYRPLPLEGRLRISVEWRTPTEPAGDVDGLLGGLMDALQPDQNGPRRDMPWSFWAGRVVFANDGIIREIGSVRWVPSPERVIRVILEEIEAPQPLMRPRGRKQHPSGATLFEAAAAAGGEVG